MSSRALSWSLRSTISRDVNTFAQGEAPASETEFKWVRGPLWLTRLRLQGCVRTSIRFQRTGFVTDIEFEARYRFPFY